MNKNISITKFVVAEITNPYYGMIHNSKKLRPYNFLGYSTYYSRGLMIVDVSEKASKLMPKLRLDQSNMFWKSVDIDEAIEVLNIIDSNLTFIPSNRGNAYVVTTSGLSLSFVLKDEDDVLFSRPTNRKELEKLICKLENANVDYMLDYADRPQYAPKTQIHGAARPHPRANVETQFLNVLGQCLAERYRINYMGVQRCDTHPYGTVVVAWGAYRLVFTIDPSLLPALQTTSMYFDHTNKLRDILQDEVNAVVGMLKKVNGHASDDDLVLMLSEHAIYY